MQALHDTMGHATLLGAELPDVLYPCIGFDAGVIAYMGNEWQALAYQRNSRQSRP
jgi:hypothetical protein